MCPVCSVAHSPPPAAAELRRFASAKPVSCCVHVDTDARMQGWHPIHRNEEPLKTGSTMQGCGNGKVLQPSCTAATIHAQKSSDVRRGVLSRASPPVCLRQPCVQMVFIALIAKRAPATSDHVRCFARHQLPGVDTSFHTTGHKTFKLYHPSTIPTSRAAPLPVDQAGPPKGWANRRCAAP